MVFSLFSGREPQMVTAADALPGRDTPMPVPATHHVLGTPLQPPWPDGVQTAIFAMGCFWGAERAFWQAPGVYSTAVGYSGGHTPNPTYREVCSGRTGHTESVLVAFDPSVVTYEQLLAVFWEGHDPTQGMRQGNDVGTQYRSAVYTARRHAGRRGGRLARCLPAGAHRRRPRRASPPRSPPPAPSGTPRPSTSSTWRSTPAATAASAAPG